MAHGGLENGADRISASSPAPVVGSREKLSHRGCLRLVFDLVLPCCISVETAWTGDAHGARAPHLKALGLWTLRSMLGGRPGSGGARAVKVPIGRAIGGDVLRPRLGEDSRPMSHIGWIFKGD